MVKQIQKLQQGTNPEWEYNQALASATDDNREHAEAIVESLRRWESFNSLNSRKDKKQRNAIYQYATSILKGETPQIQFTNGWAYDLLDQFYKQNGQNSKPQTAVKSSTSAPSNIQSYFLSNNYFSGHGPRMTKDERAQLLLTNILADLNSASNIQGSAIRNINGRYTYFTPTQIAQLKGYLEALRNSSADQIINGIKSKQGELEFTTDQWDAFFEQLDQYDESSEKENRLYATGYNPYTNYSAYIQQELGKDGYRIWRKNDGSYIATNDQFDVVSSPLYYIDPSDNSALFINNEKSYIGSLDGVNESSSYYNLYNEALNHFNDKYDQNYVTRDFNLKDDYSTNDLVNTLAGLFRNNNYSQNAFSYADVSRMFKSDIPVLAFHEDGSGLQINHGIPDLKDQKLQFIWQDSNGKVFRGNLEAAKKNIGEFNIAGYEENLDQTGPLYNLNQDNLFDNQIVSLDTKQTKGWNFKDAAKAGTVGAAGGAAVGSTAGTVTLPVVGTVAGWLGGGLVGFLGGVAAYTGNNFLNSKSINDNPQAFAHNVLHAMKNPNTKANYQEGAPITGSQYLTKFNNGDLKSIIETINYLYADKRIKLSEDDMQFLRTQYVIVNPDALKAITAHAEGGVLKALKGTDLYPQVQPDSNNWHEKYNKQLTEALNKEQKVKEAGYRDLEHYDANKSTALTAADALRFTTMAQDVASIIASFAPGAGTAAAAGLGVGAMGTDLVADIMDPAVTGGEVVKNLGMNAAFAALGMVPGAKMSKVAKNIVKYAPKIITAVAGLGIATDESTQKTFKKITDGKEKLNREDWRNLSHVLSLIAGTTRSARNSWDSRKVRKSVAMSTDEVVLKGIKDPATGKDIQLPKSQIDDLNAKLKQAKSEKDVEEVFASFKNKDGKKVFTADVIKDAQKNGIFKKIFKKDKTIHDLSDLKGVKVEETVDKGKTYDNLRALWNEDAEALHRQSQTTLGRIAIGIGNTLGGGAYGGKQRAILRGPNTPENVADIAKYLEYEGQYNPMIDWKGLRTNSGMTMLEARQATTTPNKSVSNIAIHPQKRFAAEVARENVSDEMKNGPLAGRYKTIGTEKLEEAVSIVQTKTNVPISNKERFANFVAHLRRVDPTNYTTRLGSKQFMKAAKAEYKFKDGGRINSYSHLRK